LGTDVGAVNAYRKLASDDDIVAIIGPDSSNDSMAQSPSALEFKILTTAQGSSPTLKDMCNNDNKYLFQLRACDDTLCEALIKYSVEELGLKSYAVIHDTETSSADQARLFTEALKSYGIEPIVTVPFTTGTKDFSSHIAQIQASGAETIIGAAFQTEAAILIQQIRSFGIEAPILGSNGFADPVTIQLAGEMNDNVYCASAWVPETLNPKGAALSKKYKELYGEDCGKAAAQIYDHISIICEAIKLADSTDREAVRAAMSTISDYQGAITKYDCRTNGDCGRGGILVKVVKGKAQIISEITSEKVLP
jgi:branched-chain amino acid transport system substrate-binding protein